MCLGDELAKMLLFLYCGNIVWNFEFSGENLDVKSYGNCGITLNPSEYWLLFRKLII